MHNYTYDELDELKLQLKHSEKRYNILLELIGEMSKLFPKTIDISELDKSLRKAKKVKEITITKTLTAKEVTDETIEFLRKQFKNKNN